ncbi:MAG: hypothetical protein WKG07_40765 [Hymenobacter sp.]
MDTLLQNENKEKRGVNKVLLAALAVAAVLVAGGIWLLTFQPTMRGTKTARLSKALIWKTRPNFKITQTISLSPPTPTARAQALIGSRHNSDDVFTAILETKATNLLTGLK